MYLVSGFVNIFLLLIIFFLGNSNMQAAVYEIPAIIAVIIGWVSIFKAARNS